MFVLLHNLGGNNPNLIPRLFRNKNTGKYYTVVRNVYWLNGQLFVNIPVVLELSYQDKLLYPVSDTNLFKQLLDKVSVEVKINDDYYLVWDTDSTTNIIQQIINNVDWNTNVIQIDYTGSNLLKDLISELKVVDTYTFWYKNDNNRYRHIPLVVFFVLFEPFGVILNKDNFQNNSKYLLLYYYQARYSLYHSDNLIMHSDSSVNCNRILPFALLDMSCLVEYPIQYGTELNINFVFPESEQLILEFLANDNVQLSPIVWIYKAYNDSAEYVKIEVSDNTGLSIEDIVGSNIYQIANEFDTLEKSENAFRKSLYRLLFIPKALITSDIKLEYLSNTGSYLVQFFDWYLLSNMLTFRLETKSDNLIVPANFSECLTFNYKNVDNKELIETISEVNELITEQLNENRYVSKLYFRLPNEAVDITSSEFEVYSSFNNSYINYVIKVDDNLLDSTTFDKTLRLILFEKPDVEIITNIGSYSTKDYQVSISDNGINLSFMLPDSLVNEVDGWNFKLNQLVKTGLLYEPVIITEVKIGKESD